MGKQYAKIESQHREFIARQHVFFTATATAESRINLSPKGLHALRILDDHTVAYLDLTGSGNEAAAHLRADGRLTLMFCAFEGNPQILRLYGRAHTLTRGSAAYESLPHSAFQSRSSPVRDRSSSSPLTSSRHPAASASRSSTTQASGPISSTGP